ncbi:MAG: hypothetical protein AAGM22_16465 [Acidobacteriota bacterium]
MLRKSTLLILSFTSIIAGFFAAVAEASPALATIDSGAQATVRSSGEVQLMLDQTYRSSDRTFRVSLSFASESDLARAERRIEGVDLQDLDLIFVVGPEGKVVEKRAEGVSLLDAARGSYGTLCSDVLARGLKQVGKGLWVGVSVHGGSALRRPEPPSPGDGYEWIYDIFGTCAFFSIGCEEPGPGGLSSSCTNAYRTSPLEPYTLVQSACSELHGHAGPGLCSCAVLGF